LPDFNIFAFLKQSERTCEYHKNKKILMQKQAEIKLSLVILISLFIHAVIFTGTILPVYHDFFNILKLKNALNKAAPGRDIIVNINEDNKKIINKTTLLSEKDSSAKGYITKKKGDQWLNNSRDFQLEKGNKFVGKSAANNTEQKNKTGIILRDTSELIINIFERQGGGVFGKEGLSDFTRIPDKYSFTKDNTIFYSNDGTFSFNTQNFKPFKYFKEMKDKIAQNWNPPIFANAVLPGYFPGRVRIMAIPNQIVMLYFTMNRNGDVLDVGIIDSMESKSLDKSCVDSIRQSKNFGIVPTELKGEIILIRFGFIYIIKD
jgi:hypothetical protein